MELTKEQILFYKGKQILYALDEIEQERPLTAKEKAKKDAVLTRLFQGIHRYANQLAHETISKYPRLPSDAYADLQQMLAQIFFEKLREYDPLRSTPTTFFVRHFRQKISEYIQENITHLSQYDSSNARKVFRAIHHYESRGIQWTMDMISNRCGLSIKVVKSTIALRHKAQYATTDDDDNLLQIKSKIQTPEAELLDAERKKTLFERINYLLSDSEKELLMARINPEGAKEMPYADVAEQFGITIKECKQRLNSIRCRLNQDPVLRHQFHNKKSHMPVGIISFNDNAMDILDQQIAFNENQTKAQ